MQTFKICYTKLLLLLLSPDAKCQMRPFGGPTDGRISFSLFSRHSKNFYVNIIRYAWRVINYSSISFCLSLLFVILLSDAVFNLCHRQSLESAAFQPLLLERGQFGLAHVVHQTGADRVAEHVDGRSETVQQPVDGQNDGDVFGGQTDRVEHHDHGDEAGLRYSRGADGSRSGRDGNGNDLADAQFHVPYLGDENGRHSFVQRGSVHVDSGSDWQDESGDPRVHLVLLLEEVDGDRERGRGRGRAERRGESVGHVGDESERHRPRANRIDDGKDDEAVNEEAAENRDEVEPQLAGHQTHILHFQYLSADEEEDADGGQVDDPRGDSHHGLGETSEEIQ